MRHKLLFLVSLTLTLLWGCRHEQEKDYTRYVDPFIGTDATHFVSEWRSEACTYPGAVAPHGMLQISPETSAPGEYLRGYYYSQDTIRRFSLAEHFSGWPDGSAGKGIIMPFNTDDPANLDLRRTRAHFTHEREVAEPGYYSVYLDDPGISCSFAALTRAAIGTFLFEQSGQSGLMMGGFKSMEPVSDNEIRALISAGSGYIGGPDHVLYLYLVFDKSFEVQKQGKMFLLTFEELTDDPALSIRVGASYTSAENARLNLQSEIPRWDLEETRTRSRQRWNGVLSRVEAEGGTEEDMVMLYTALYHGSLLPINATDVNREYPGQEANEPLGPGETHYVYYTPWDAFRTLYPMINFLYPEKGLDYMRSLLRIYRAAGRLPEPEVMTSVHMSVLFADAVARGVDDFDHDLAFQALRELILDPPYFRPDMVLYDSLGYIPYPHRYATTATLEFAFNDWALSRLANKVGKNDIAEHLRERSLNYRNNYNPRTRFMETRNYDGSWSDVALYAEADKWNMSWFVPHDNQGLVNLMGGDEAFCRHLERNFSEGHFILDNECPMNFPFLFSYAGKPWKTMEWKSKALRYHFNTSPGGIPGNDDWGTMSSWYAWGAMGLFPVCPGTDELIITGPVFEKLTIRRDEGHDLVIEAPDVSADNVYVQKCRLGGSALNQVYVRQSDLIDAGRIVFEMGPEPNKNWAANGQRPYSVTKSTPDFEVVSLGIREQRVHSHEPFRLYTEIRNQGVVGSFPLYLTLNGDTIYRSFPLLPARSRRQVPIPLRLYRGGNATLSVDQKSVAIEVQATRLPPDQALRFDAPEVSPLIHIDDSIRIECKVMNVSGYTSNLMPSMYVDGTKATQLDQIAVAPGDTATVSAVLGPLANTGFHRISCGQGPATQFKVYRKPEETMVLHYTFDDAGDGIVPDHSGFGNHGEIIGELKYVPGIDGRGIMVQDGYVEAPKTRSLAIEDETLTMLCWYKPADEDGKASLVTKGAHNMMKLNGKWQLQLAIGGWGVGQCNYNAPYDPAINGPAWQGKWSHFAGMRSDDTLHIFYNGDHVSRLPVQGVIGHTDFRWCVGTNAEIPIGRTPDGVIDEVMIFAGALDKEAIAAIYRKHQIL